MYATALRSRQYQRQAIATASPVQLVGKLYDLAVAACRAGDHRKLRKVTIELMAGLDREAGGDLAERLGWLYEYTLQHATTSELGTFLELFEGLRDAWYEGVLQRRAA